MKGVVFTEFLELVDSKFGMAVTDQVMSKGCPFQRGFTSVGTYDYRDLLAMVNELSNQTSTSSAMLIRVFGKHLFQVFLSSYPDAFCNVSTTYELLLNVEDTIHVEVRKLYPDAELPTFTFDSTNPKCLLMEYQSTRPFAELAGGLIDASIEHFAEDITVECVALEGPAGTHALFTLHTNKEI